jgi:hypothetical protein
MIQRGALRDRCEYSEVTERKPVVCHPSDRNKLHGWGLGRLLISLRVADAILGPEQLRDRRYVGEM